MPDRKNSLRSLRKLHGRLHDASVNAKTDIHLELLKLKGRYLSMTEKKTLSSFDEDYPVDFVVTWVDDQDPEWQKARSMYSSAISEPSGDDASRYREWDTFRYWFRGVEQYAPWVRYIYLVTYGHVPKWLNLEHPKLKVIKHEDFIDSKYLPTFSSHAIEINLHKIEGLSEHFVYFNDDMYLCQPVYKQTFFYCGLPKYSAVANPIFPFLNMNSHIHSQLNCIGMINGTFNIRKCMEEHPEKWFSNEYGSYVSHNERAYIDKKLSGMYFSHLPVPYRKSTMYEVCEHFPALIDRTQANRFRSSDNVMHQIFELWEICKGTFEPVTINHYGKHINLGPNEMQSVKEYMKNNKIVCLNDNECIKTDDFSEMRRQLSQIMDSKYPFISDFEKVSQEKTILRTEFDK